MTNLEIILATFSIAIISIVGIYLSKKKFHSLFNPTSIYCMIWSPALFFVITNFCKNFYPISRSAFIIFLIAMIMFIIGSFLSPNNKLNMLHQLSNKKKHYLYLWLHRFYLVIAIISLLGSVKFLIDVIKYFGIDCYLYKGYIVHQKLFTGDKVTEFPGGIWNFRFVQYVIHPIIYLSASLAIANLFIVRKRKLLYFIPILSAIIFDLAIVGRFRIYTILLIYLFAFFVDKKEKIINKNYIYNKFKLKSNKKAIYFLGILGILTYVIISILRSYDKGSYYDFYGLGIPSFIFTILKYQIGGLYLFSIAYKNCSQYSYGYEVFYPIFGKLLNFLGIGKYHHEYILGEKFYIGPNDCLNAFHTYLYIAYLDFGWFGIILYPLILGWLSGLIYMKANTTNNVLWNVALVLIYALIIAPSTMVWGLGDFSRVIAFLTVLSLSIAYEFHLKFSKALGKRNNN